MQRNKNASIIGVISLLVLASILLYLFFQPIKSYFHVFFLKYSVEQPLQQKQTSSSVNDVDIIKVFKFDNIYEPSGVLQLKDGRLLIVEDEAERSLHILSINEDNQVSENKSLSKKLRDAFKLELNDLEAITIGSDGFLYASTSHKRTKKGKRKKTREQLIRFKIEGNDITHIGVVANLLDAIKQTNIFKSTKHINIEGLSFDKQNRLMICLREPLINKKAVILILENPVAIFEKQVKPSISKDPILLDLGGSGIRAMSYINELNGYLLSNEVLTKNTKKKQSQLYFWDGDPQHKAEQIKLHDLISNVEGIAPITAKGTSQVFLVGDNGSIKKNRSANYVLLEYHQIMRSMALRKHGYLKN